MTEQVPPARVHVVELNVPDPEVENVTVPVGLPLVPVTVAVHLDAVPTVSGFGLQVTEVVDVVVM